MKVLNIHIPRVVKTLSIVTPLLLTTPAKSINKEVDRSDEFVKTTNEESFHFTTNPMNHAIWISVGNKTIFPNIIVDLSENTLYQYDNKGQLINTYPVASGKKTTPTHTGLRKIVAIESYPYKNSPKTSKRHKNPSDYGPKVFILGIVDPKTGELTGYNGEFLHGTNQPTSIGKYASKGCIRVHNDVIKKLADEIKNGQYVLIKE